MLILTCMQFQFNKPSYRSCALRNNFVLILFVFCVRQHPKGHFLSRATVEKVYALVFRIRWEFRIGRYRFDPE